MRLALIGLAGGAAVVQQLAQLPGPLQIAGLGTVALLLFALRRNWAMLAGGLTGGVAWAAWLALLALAPVLAPADEGRDIAVVGIVDSLPHRFEQGVRFNFRIERSVAPALRLPPRVALSWYRDGRAAPSGPLPGERWHFTVRLQRPHGNANPHGFDYEVWLLEQGLRATGYVRGDARRLSHFVPGFGTVVERSRAALRDRIERTLDGKPYAGVIVALVVGDQRAIDQEDWTIFNRTGVGHLISISCL